MGTVAAKKNKGYHKLSDYEEFAILEALVERPSMYLKEVCRHVYDTTGTVITESAVCRFLQRNNFSHKKLTNLAKQCSELLRQCFMSQCEIYDPDMMVFVDETGCDRRSSMRKFGYALKGTHGCTTIHTLCIMIVTIHHSSFSVCTIMSSPVYWVHNAFSFL